MRHGISFAECLAHCAGHQELIANFDRLAGSNLSLRGSGLDLAIDQTTGRLDAEIEAFIEFCWECVFLRFGNSIATPR